MAEEAKKDAGEKKAQQKVAAPAKPANVEKLVDAGNLEGDNKAVVNPDLKSLEATLFDSEGNSVPFIKGEVYYVSDEALQKQNTEKVNYLVEAE